MNQRRYRRKMYVLNNNYKDRIRAHKRNLLYLTMFSAVILIVITSMTYLNAEVQPDVKIYREERGEVDLKYVLFWNTTMSTELYTSGQHMPITNNCPNINCFITFNRSFFKDQRNFDAIIFDVRDVRKRNLDIPIKRSPHQKYIFKSFEAAEKYPICNPKFENFFNLTWTYRLDSDIAQPFFDIHDSRNKHVGPLMNMRWINKMKPNFKVQNKLKDKTYAVAWLIKSCATRSKNFDLVNKLKSELLSYGHVLNIVGECAANSCPDNVFWKCYTMLEKSYFFNIVIEEYDSEDYVTDLAIKTLNHYVIPVVFGSSNYSRFLPPGSFIDAKSMDIKKVGAIINYLMLNPGQYTRLFDWKNYYYFLERPKNRVCELCIALNGKKRLTERKSYKHFRKWWNPSAVNCNSWFGNETH